MDPITFAQLNEAYHKGVYGQEETLDIQEWVEALIDEGYDLDQYTDDELYEAYLDEVKGGGFIPQSGTTYNTDYQSPAAKRRQAHRTSGWISRSEQEKSMQKSGIRSRTAVGSREEIPSRNIMGTGTSPSGSDSGLSMSPAKRAELAAKRAERGGDSKRANKIRSTMTRTPVSEDLDLYDLVSEYLVSEGFCDSYEDADVIMANMSEEWRDGIVEEVLEEATVLSVSSPGGKKRTLNVTKAKPARNLSGSEWHDAAKTSRDLKKQREASSFSPQAERAARTRGQEQVSRGRQSDQNMRIRFATSALQRRFGIPDSALDPADRSKDIPKRSVSLREELDLYDLVSEYLVSEGFCDSYEDADVIMANMSEEWRESILDEVTGGGQIRFRKGLPGRSPKKSGMVATPQQKAALKLGRMDVDPTTDPKRRERQARVALR